MGVPVVLSDIAINREIDRAPVIFLQAGNPGDLAEKTIPLLRAEPRNVAPRQLLLDSDASLSRLSVAIVDYLDGFKTRNSP
jgi:hypothetical protein